MSEVYKTWKYGDRTMEEYALAVLKHIELHGGFVAKDSIALTHHWQACPGALNHYQSKDRIAYAGIHAISTQERLKRIKNGDEDWYGEPISNDNEEDGDATE